MTKRFFGPLVAMMCLLLLALPMSRVQAAGTDTISVTVTITLELSVSVSPGAWAIGSVSSATSSVDTTGDPPGGPDYFTATNDGNVAENLDVSVSCGGWAPSLTPGLDAFAMNLSTTGASPTWKLIDPTNGTLLVTGLPATQAQSFDLQLLLPTATTTGGSEQTITITVTAATSGP